MKDVYADTLRVGSLFVAGLVCGALLGRRNGRRWRHARRDSIALYDELGLLRDELERERTEREALVRRAAHDLRNTLTPIRARAEILIRKFGEEPEQTRHTQAILRSVVRADSVIQELSNAGRAHRAGAPARHEPESEASHRDEREEGPAAVPPTPRFC